MKQSLIAKYIPNNLDEFISNQNLIDFLKGLIKINELNFLLLGESGTGKTSIIKNVIKKYYNNNNTNNQNEHDNNYNDILSLNPMNEHNVNYFRNEIKIFCQTLSENNKKKTLVLDDLDTINENNQEIIKNCIDKYSYNVNFMCSSKNLQKITPSLQTRLIILKVEDINSCLMNKIINVICENEKININDDAKDFIILLSNYSLKSMINYLEKIQIYNEKVDLNVVIKLCTSVSYEDFFKYTEYCKKNDLNNALNCIFNIKNNCYSIIDILDIYYYYIKNCNNITDEFKYKIIKLISEYITYYYILHEDNIELIFFTNKLCLIWNNNLNDNNKLLANK